MTHAKSQAAIDCPIGLFEPQEAKVETLTASINTATRAPEKALVARELLREVNVLLDCASFDRSNRNCALCRNFSELRRKAATLLVEVGALGAAS